MKTKSFYRVFITILFLAVIFSVFYFFKNRSKINSISISNPQDLTGSVVNSENVPVISDKIENGKYINDALGFSIPTLSDMTTSNFVDGGGTTILLKSRSKNFQMQIYISPFDDDVNLTIARIKQDIPEMKMIEPIEIKTDGVGTVAFFSTDRGAKYREIWFVHKGNLYQILAPAGQDNITGGIMEKWKWSE